jgi:hypothetical protein
VKNIVHTYCYNIKIGCNYICVTNIVHIYCYNIKIDCNYICVTNIVHIYCYNIKIDCNYYETDYIGRGTRWCTWLRHNATSRKVAGVIPDGVIGIFRLHNYIFFGFKCISTYGLHI